MSNVIQQDKNNWDEGGERREEGASPQGSSTIT